MKRIAALVLRDLRDRRRLRQMFLVRFVFALVPVAFVLSVLLASDTVPGRGPGLARAVYMGFAFWAFWQALLALSLGLGEGHDWAAAERKSRTLSVLYITRTLPIEMVLGRAAVLMVRTVLTLIAALPVLAILAWGGGMDLATAGEAVLLALAWGLLGTAVGLVSGYATRWARYVLILVVAALGLLLVWDWSWSLTFHPGTALVETALQAPASASTASTLHAAGALAAGAALFLLWAAELIPRAARTVPLPGRRKQSFRWGARMRGNPVAWLAMRCGHVPGLGASLVVTAALAAPILWAFREVGADAAPIVYLMAWVGAAILPAFWTAPALAIERRDRTMVTLAVTPLTAERILRGKLGAALWRYLPIAVLLLASFAYSLAGDTFTLEGMAYGLGILVGGFFLCLVLGLVFSLRAPTPSRASLPAVGGALGLQFLAYALIPVPLAALIVRRQQPGSILYESSLLWNGLLGLALVVIFVLFRLFDRRLAKRRPILVVLAYGILVPLFLAVPVLAIFQFERSNELVPTFILPFLVAVPSLWAVLLLRYARLALDASMGRAP